MHAVRAFDTTIDRAVDSDAGGPAITFENVSLAFDDNVVLRDVSFSVRAGSTLFLLGASGSGKSVVLKLILGMLRPDSGVIRVRVEGVDRLCGQLVLKIRAVLGM